MTPDLDTIRRLVAEQYEVDLGSIHPTTSLADDLGSDDLSRIELTMAVEDVAEVEFTDAEIEEVRTVQDLVDVLARKLAGQVEAA